MAIIYDYDIVLSATRVWGDLRSLRWSTSYFNEHETIIRGFHIFPSVARGFRNFVPMARGFRGPNIVDFSKCTLPELSICLMAWVVVPYICLSYSPCSRNLNRTSGTVSAHLLNEKPINTITVPCIFSSYSPCSRNLNDFQKHVNTISVFACRSKKALNAM